MKCKKCGYEAEPNRFHEDQAADRIILMCPACGAIVSEYTYYEDPTPDYEVWEQNQIWEDLSAGEGQEEYE